MPLALIVSLKPGESKRSHVTHVYVTDKIVLIPSHNWLFGYILNRAAERGAGGKFPRGHITPQGAS